MQKKVLSVFIAFVLFAFSCFVPASAEGEENIEAVLINGKYFTVGEEITEPSRLGLTAIDGPAAVISIDGKGALEFTQFAGSGSLKKIDIPLQNGYSYADLKMLDKLKVFIKNDAAFTLYAVLHSSLGDSEPLAVSVPSGNNGIIYIMLSDFVFNTKPLTVDFLASLSGVCLYAKDDCNTTFAVSNVSLTKSKSTVLMDFELDTLLTNTSGSGFGGNSIWPGKLVHPLAKADGNWVGENIYTVEYLGGKAIQNTFTASNTFEGATKNRFFGKLNVYVAQQKEAFSNYKYIRFLMKTEVDRPVIFYVYCDGSSSSIGTLVAKVKFVVPAGTNGYYNIPIAEINSSSESTSFLTFEQINNITGFAFDMRDYAGAGSMILDDISLVKAAEDTDFAVPLITAKTCTVITDRIDGANGEFTIYRPGDELTKVYAADFGLSEDSADNTKALESAVAYCKAHPNTDLVIDNGVYRFQNSGRIDLSGLKNVKISGNNSKFIQRTAMFGIGGADTLEISDLNIAWDWEYSRLADVVKVLSVNSAEGEKTVEYQFLDNPNFSLDYAQKMKWLSMSQVDPQSFTFGAGADHKEIYFSEYYNNPSDVQSVELIDSDKIRVVHGNITNSSSINQIAAGDTYLLRHYTYQHHCVTIHSKSKNVTFNNFNIYGSAGMAYCVYGQSSNCQWKNCKITIDPDSNNDQHISAASDGIYISKCGPYFNVENCEIAYQGDDGFNNHTVVGVVDSVQSSNSLRVYTGGDSRMVTDIGDKLIVRSDEFELLDGVELTITKVSSETGDHYRLLTFAETLPEAVKENYILVNPKGSSGNYVLRNNYFHENRARGIVLENGNGIVEGNRFYKTQMSAIQMGVDIQKNLWQEGGGMDNVIIRNNTFDRCCVTYNWAVMAPIFFSNKLFGKQLKYPALTDITIENNTVINSAGYSFRVNGTAGVKITANTVYNPDELPLSNSSVRGSVLLENCSDVLLSSNVWKYSPNIPLQRVYKIINTDITEVTAVNNTVCRDNSGIAIYYDDYANIGDANGDGYTDVRDLIRFKKALTATNVSYNSELSDMNADASFDSADLAVLRKLLLNSSQKNDSSVTWDKTRNLIAVTDQKSRHLYVLDLDDPDWSDEGSVLWDWTPTAELGFGGLILNYWLPSEVKLRYSEQYKSYVVLTTSSGGVCAMIEYPSGKMLWGVANGGNNPHSIELLPDGNIVVASSGDNLRLYTASVKGAETQYTEVKLEAAHAAQWNPENQRLYSVGYHYVAAYAIDKSGAKPKLVLDEANTAYQEWICGHDFTPVAGNHDLYWLAGSELWQYSVSQNKIVEAYTGRDELVGNLKCISETYDNRIIRAMPDLSETDLEAYQTRYVSVTAKNSAGHYETVKRKLPNNMVAYKIRAFRPEYIY